MQHNVDDDNCTAQIVSSTLGCIGLKYDHDVWEGCYETCVLFESRSQDSITSLEIRT